MTNRMMPRAGAGCGALFAVALIATSNGSADANYIAGLAAIALFLPFLAYLCSLLREAEGEHGWLATAALAAGVAGITIKLVSVATEIAANHLPGGAVHNALQDIADAATVISMYPLALLLAAVAIITLRTRVLSRWLGYGAAVTAAALAVNAGFIRATIVPAFLLFTLWTLAASVVLFVKARSQAVHVTPAPHPRPADSPRPGGGPYLRRSGVRPAGQRHSVPSGGTIRRDQQGPDPERRNRHPPRQAA